MRRSADGDGARPTAVGRLPVRQLGPPDLPACIALAADCGWAAEHDKWRLLLAVGEAFGVLAPDGQGLAGMVTLVRYGDELAVVGMMVVASRYGRQGLGRRLMEHVLGRAGRAVVYLFATPAGQPLYTALGFRPVDTVTRHIGRYTADPDTDLDCPVHPVVTADLPGLAATDLAVFGADRGPLLAALARQADAFVVTGAAPDGRGGYGVAWPNDGVRQLGPIVAGDERVARALVARLATAGGWSGPVRLDVAGRHAGLAAWARARGLAPGAANTLMSLGGPLPGDRTRLYAPVNVAIG